MSVDTDETERSAASNFFTGEGFSLFMLFILVVMTENMALTGVCR